MSSSRHSCYHSWINPLAVLAVLLLVAMTTLQIISPVNAIIEGQEESLGHPEMMGASPFAKCKGLCEKRFTGSFWKNKYTAWDSQTIECRSYKMSSITCRIWCNYCAAEYGSGFASHPDAKFYGNGLWSTPQCDCAVYSPR
eukprot:Nk52_evm1s573 gene=Nk52_evmTU1s573